MYFFYDLSPILIQYTEVTISFSHFLTNLCAIIGGVFTIAGLLDSCVFHSLKTLERKIELGKAT